MNSFWTCTQLYRLISLAHRHTRSSGLVILLEQLRTLRKYLISLIDLSRKALDMLPSCILHASFDLAD